MQSIKIELFLFNNIYQTFVSYFSVSSCKFLTNFLVRDQLFDMHVMMRILPEANLNLKHNRTRLYVNNVIKTINIQDSDCMPRTRALGRIIEAGPKRRRCIEPDSQDGGHSCHETVFTRFSPGLYRPVPKPPIYHIAPDK